MKRNQNTSLSMLIGFSLLALNLFGKENSPIDFNRDILPIFSDNCFHCHGPDAKARKADLRLDQPEGLLLSSENTPLLIPGNPDSSEIVKRLESKDSDEVMPPPESNRSLTEKQIRTIRLWIEQGAPWQDHWSFKKLTRPNLPEIQNRFLPRNPLDHFILNRLERVGLSFNPEANKEILIRRVSLDLTGLPPTLEELDAFLRDDRPDAYDRLIDRLLLSPRYGERMVWDWLEAARYADSNGYQGDRERTMWPWRDWVIKALNTNQPFDQFTIDQLAGDLVPTARFDQILATGFNRNHMINGEGGRIPEENRMEYVMDMTETVGTVWLGLTLNCCRCHDHKFDPLTRKEYYQLSAFFNQTPINGGGGDPQTAPILTVPGREQKTQLLTLETKIQNLSMEVSTLEKNIPALVALTEISEQELSKPTEKEVRKALAPSPCSRNKDQLNKIAEFFTHKHSVYVNRIRALQNLVNTRNQLNRSIPKVMVMKDRETRRESFILTMGLYNQPEEKVNAGTPSSLPDLPTDRHPDRLSLAQWLVSPDNPLTARVIVNRYWQIFFDEGLVRTPEDFGTQGKRPTHPGLLDFLATEFIRTEWNVKALHRLIVTSTAYRQSSKVSQSLQERDPENELLARGPRARRPSWMLRDQALAASGLISDPIGGPSVMPYQPGGIWREATFGKKTYTQDHGGNLYRRSVYTFWRRIVGPTQFFDVSKRQSCVVKPTRTNSPLHALLTLNETTYVEAARQLAQRTLIHNDSNVERIRFAFRSVTARFPTESEQHILQERLNRLGHHFESNSDAVEHLLQIGESANENNLDPVEHAAYTLLCNLILNLDETLSKQ
ncbi:MAG TPA: DUF1553 domain-containing protein [Verrucomicrobiales bacterium]|nr:DUF1553 domain-containing protein [Verrucomicrobiales bacterium]